MSSNRILLTLKTVNRHSLIFRNRKSTNFWTNGAQIRYYAVGQRRVGNSFFNNRKPLQLSSWSFLSVFRGPTTSQNETAKIYDESFLSEIGAIPAIPDVPSKVIPIPSVTENIRELGLGSYFTPVGWIQNFLDVLHSATGLPWWEVIALATVIIRTCTLPIIVSSQRRSAVLPENQAEFQKLVQRLETAKRSGDKFAIQLVQMEAQQFMQEKHFPAMKRMLLPMFANGAIFTTYFLALRGMASKSLASMQTGGVLWFTDLTVADPMFMLPTMCALSTLVVMEIGIEFGIGANQLSPGLRWAMRLAPFAILLVANKIPAAVMVYWLTNNVISLFLAVIFRITAVRQFLKIPPLPPPKSRTSLRESWRLPQFVIDYLSAPLHFMRAAKAKFGKGESKPASTKNTSDKKTSR